MIRVVIADDQALVRAGLAALLGSEPDIDVVGVAADGTQALALARDLRPDVACLDIRMPGMNGIEVARALCGPGADPSIPVLMLTTFDLDDYVFGALEAGASGFLLKDADPEVIVGAVRQVAAGNGTLDQALTRRILREFVDRRRLQPVTGARADGLLTAREREVSSFLPRGCRTRRSRRRSSSRCRRSSRTWPGCFPSSGSAPASRPWSGPTRTGSSASRAPRATDRRVAG